MVRPVSTFSSPWRPSWPASRRVFPSSSWPVPSWSASYCPCLCSSSCSLMFEMMAREVDPYIEAKGRLNGLMVQAKSFPGWHDFAALVSHLKFVKDHHQRIAKVAAVTDNGFLSILPSIVKHFVRADVRHFDYGDKENALKWLGSHDD